MNAGRRRRTAWVLAALALVPLACGSEEATLDRSATEQAVGDVVGDRVGVAATDTTCPSKIREAKGTKVRCTVRLKGLGPVRVTVRQVDDEGRLDVVVLDAVIDNAEVTRTLKAQLKAQFARSFQADCGTGTRIVRPGTSFRCKARDRAGRRTVLVTVTDAAGTLHFRVLS